MTPTIPACSRCHGARHVLGPSGWVECACLGEHQRRAARLSCGLAGPLNAMSWKTLGEKFAYGDRRVLAGLIVSIRRMESPMVVASGDYQGATALWALLLDEAIGVRRSVQTTDVRALVDRSFSREGPDPIKQAAVLGLRVGSEPQHAWNAGVLEGALRTRLGSQRMTVVLLERPVPQVEARYAGSGVPDQLAAFQWIDVQPRIV